MAEKLSAGGGQRVYVMRHGERLDSIDRQWTKRAARPYDTPLSSHGRHEAMRLVKQRLPTKVSRYRRRSSENYYTCLRRTTVRVVTATTQHMPVICRVVKSHSYLYIVYQ